MSAFTDKAFEIVFREHQRMVTAYLHSLLGSWPDAADLAQETFVVAYAKLESFDASRPVAPWLRGIARHLALNHRRKRARRELLFDHPEALEAVYALFDEPRHDEAWDARLQALDHCVERLPDQQKTVVLQHYRDDESAQAIAARLAVTVKTVFQTLWRARLNLKTCIEDLLPEPGAQHDA